MRCPDVDADIHSEQVQRMLIGGLSIVGVVDVNVSQGRGLLHQCLGEGAPMSSLDSYIITFDGAVARVREGSVTQNVPTSVAALRTKLAVKPSVVSIHACVGQENQQRAPGSAVEALAAEIAAAISSQIRVAEDGSVWCSNSHGISVGPPKGSLRLEGTITGLVASHTEASAEEKEKWLLEDLGRAVQTRVQVALDELDDVQEEKNSSEEHALARVGRTLASLGNKSLRWTLPRRVLVKASFPFCDWQLPNEYEGKQTVGRASEIMGQKVSVEDIESLLEGDPIRNATFSLTGIQQDESSTSKGKAVTTQKPASTKQVVKQTEEARNKTNLALILGVCIILLVSMIMFLMK